MLYSMGRTVAKHSTVRRHRRWRIWGVDFWMNFSILVILMLSALAFLCFITSSTLTQLITTIFG